MKRIIYSLALVVAVLFASTGDVYAQKARRSKKATTTTATTKPATTAADVFVSEITAQYDQAAASVLASSINEVSSIMMQYGPAIQQLLNSNENSDVPVTEQQKRKVADSAYAFLKSGVTVFAQSQGVSTSNPQVVQVLNQAKSKIDNAVSPCTTLGELRAGLRSVNNF